MVRLRGRRPLLRRAAREDLLARTRERAASLGLGFGDAERQTVVHHQRVTECTRYDTATTPESSMQKDFIFPTFFLIICITISKW